MSRSNQTFLYEIFKYARNHGSWAISRRPPSCSSHQSIDKCYILRLNFVPKIREDKSVSDLKVASSQYNFYQIMRKSMNTIYVFMNHFISLLWGQGQELRIYFRKVLSCYPVPPEFILTKKIVY